MKANVTPSTNTDEMSFLQTFESGLLETTQPQGKVRSVKFKEDLLEGIIFNVTDEEVAGLNSILDRIILAAIEFLRSGRSFRKADVIDALGLIAVEARLTDVMLNQVSYRAAISKANPNFDIIRSDRGKVTLIEFVKISDGLRPPMMHEQQPLKHKSQVHQLL